jgi:hypothetical protein
MTRATHEFPGSLLLGGALAIALAATPAASAGEGNEQWVGTWSTALLAGENAVLGTSRAFSNQTLRQIVHTSVGGDRVRVRLSTFGSGALAVGAAHIARSVAGAAIDPTSDRILTFGGEPSITIPPGRWF